MNYITFNDIIDDYYLYSSALLKNSTFTEQKYHINKYIVPYFKDKNIYDLNFKDINLWKRYILNFNFSYNYESNLYYHLCNIFDFLTKFYELNRNYARIDGNFKNNDFVNNGNIWSIDEFNQFISFVDNKRYNLLFRLLFFSGMRKGELLALTKSDLCFENNTIRINKALTNRKAIATPKTLSSVRTIHINDKLMRDLKKFVKNMSDSDLIFSIGFTQLERVKNKYCKIANVKQIKIHEFRHSHACYLFQNNIPIDEISHRLGHANLSTTLDTYLKYLPVNEKRVESLLNSVN